MALLPGLTKETILGSIRGPRFDHISAIYNLLLDEKLEAEAPPPGSPTYFNLLGPPQRKASITTGVVERGPGTPADPTMPEIHLFLNDSQIFEKVDLKKYKLWKFILIKNLNCNETVWRNESGRRRGRRKSRWNFPIPPRQTAHCWPTTSTLHKLIPLN